MGSAAVERSGTEGRDALREYVVQLRAAGDVRPLEGRDVDRIGPYRSYGELVDEQSALAERGARIAVEGRTPAGRPIVALEFGPESAETISVVIAGVHAMEWIGVEVGRAIAAQLAADPPRDRRVVIFPLLNPDGYATAEADLRAARRRFRRTNAHGVDLNRNFPTHWRRFHLRSRVVPPLGDGGIAPGSEPEVAAVVRRLDREVDAGAKIDRAISLHSFGRKILYPFGGRFRAPPDRDRLRAEAKALRDRMPSYEVVQVARWVPGAFAHGLEIDHLYVRYGATALLIELSSGGVRALDPSSWAHPLRWFNPRDPETAVAEVLPALEGFVRATARRP